MDVVAKCKFAPGGSIHVNLDQSDIYDVTRIGTESLF
jgi:hypothetical protein